MALGLGSSLVKGGASLLTYVKDNLKLYLDFKSNKSDTLKFPSEGSTSFDDGQYIRTGSNIGISGASPRTFCLWVTTNDISKYQELLTWGSVDTSSTPTASTLSGIYFYQSKIFFFGWGTGDLDTGTAPLAEWQHLAVTYDGTTVVVYQNGVSIGSGAKTLNTTDTPVTLGHLQTQNGNLGLDGKMANVAIWSRALEPEEIQSIMNKSYSQLKGVEKTSLVSWWALDTETLSDNLATSWANGAGDAEVFNTDGANIISLVNSSGHANVTTNSFATRYRVYKVSYDYTLVSGTHPKFFTATNTSQDSNIPTSATFATYGSSWYFTADTGTNFAIWSSSTFSISVDNFSIQEVISADSHGSNTGYYSASKSAGASSHNSATTTTSVYGGNAPILPRAVDVAKEGQADAIGDGSALFNGSSDFVQVKDSSILDAPASWTLSAWIKIGSGTSGYDRIIGKQVTGGQCNYGIGLRNGNEFGTFINDGGGFNDSNYHTTDLTVGEWYHVTGTWDGTYLKSYINGILVETSSDLSSANASVTNTAPLLIGRNATDGDQYFKGNISQAGVWQGALNQAQIQSVMESTSYSKIPSSVKSTLGSELMGSDTDFTLSGTQSASTSGTYWVTGANWTIADGKAVYDDGGNTTIDVASATISSAGLYKLTFDISDANTQAQIKLKADSNDIVNTALYNNGSNTVYWVQSAYGSPKTLKIEGRTGGSSFKIDNVSVKKVTNDLVAYYPLDGSSSRGNGTDDVTTGEVLGSELVQDSDWTEGAGWQDTGDNTWTWTSAENPTPNAHDGTSLTASNISGLTTGNIYLYKIQYTITSNSTNIALRWQNINFFDGGVTINSTVGTHIYYGFATSDDVGFRHLSGDGTIGISNISLKQVTSNTGVLK